MKLKLTSKSRPKTVSPEIQRRERLIHRIDQQIGYIRQIIEGKKPRAAWVWMSADGTYYLPINYGKQALELQKGMVSIECQNLDEVEHALCEVRGMVLAGKLDDQLQNASSAIREKFKTNGSDRA
jgi:hypothetical protein|tara:strand:- start:481 stop:855 length:375 start_codon:yes stop_codon:yes gene_type:complete